MSDISLQWQQYEQMAHRAAPGGKLRRNWPLKGGISAEMVALEVETANGRIKRMVIRQYSDGHLRQNPAIAHDEYRLLQITQGQGLKTPAPILLDQSGEIIVRPYLVLQYIEGEMDFSPKNLVSVMRQLADHLVKIHRVNQQKVDLSFLSERGKACLELSRESLSTVDSSSMAGRIEARLLTAGPLKASNGATLLHGDFWPGNSLWRDGKLAAVIDWEDAVLGDPLIDLANSRAEIAWIFGLEAANVFTHAYQSRMDLDYGNLSYYDLCAVLRVLRIAGGDLAGLASYFVPYGRDDISAESIEKNLLLLVDLW